MSENTVAQVVASVAALATPVVAPAGAPAAAVDSFLDEYVMEQVTIRSAALVKKSKLPPDMQEDVQQQMIMALLRAQKRFDPARAGSRTYASRVMDSFSKDFIRAQASKREQGCFDLPCADVGEDFSLDRYPAGEGVLAELTHDETTARVRRVMDTLPNNLRRVCDAILQSRGNRGVCHQLGINRKTFYRRLAKLQWRFREAGVTI